MRQGWILLILLMNCGGSLTEEQRKQLREGQEQQAIAKVSEADLLQAAFDKGRSVMPALQQEGSDAVQIDSLSKVHEVRIRWLDPNSGNAMEIEKQIIDAYLSGAMTGNELTDNVQRVGTDSLVYTMVVINTLPDGAIEVKGTWNIWMSTRELVLSMDKKKY